VTESSAGSAGRKRHAPAAMRNRAPIIEVLAEELPVEGLVLEVASGSGEHVVAFARRFPDLDWQPSDADPSALASIEAWGTDEALPNLRDPVTLDAASGTWPVDRADALLCINMVHISPWSATAGLMRGAGRLLRPGAPLILYGPYRQHGVATAPSNEAFDRSLKDRDAQWGLRLVEDVAAEAEANGLGLTRIVEMPANNLILVFRKR
jgi:SAM-dependent methyltransferase